MHPWRPHSMNLPDETPSSASFPGPDPAAAPAPFAPDPGPGATGFVMPPLLWGAASLSAAARPASWLWHGHTLDQVAVFSVDQPFTNPLLEPGDFVAVRPRLVRVARSRGIGS